MDENRFKIVLDTNILLVSISSKSNYHWIFQSMIDAKFDLYITNEILTEYEEIISSKFNLVVAKNVIRTLLLLPNVYKTEIYYNWNMITTDKDDNKFVDCAVAANANFIVTNDRHFDVLSDFDFPKVEVVNASTLKNILEQT
jgi:uncharacterized protein